MNAMLKLNEKLTLPEGFSARGATMDDLEPSIRLINRWAKKHIGQDEVTDPEDLENQWRGPGCDPGRDFRLVFAPDGQLAGYMEVWTIAKPPVHPWLWGRVDPDFEGRGVGTWLLEWAERRAMMALDELPADVRFSPRLGIYRQAQEAQRLFEHRGFRRIRSSYIMHIEMQEARPEPVWPEGITLRTYDPQRDLEAVYRAENESFRDHFGYVEPPYEQGLQRFKHFMTGYEGFDPSLWFLAMDGDEVAGISLCKPAAHEDPDTGWVDSLAVRRPWRKRGIGLALLHHSFAEFYRRGKRKAGLGVDAENLTGALRLYEHAGMHVQRVFDLFEKELRGGREFAVESLEA